MNQKELREMKNAISKMKNSTYGLNGILDIVKKSMNFKTCSRIHLNEAEVSELRAFVTREPISNILIHM